MRRVLLLGAAGQLGIVLARRLGDMDLLALNRQGVDLSRPESLRAVLRAAEPSLIVNAAAYTAVDRAEFEPQLADLVNHRAVRVIAEEAQRLGALLVHYSTDYVFDGTKPDPWLEDDLPAPLNIYGASKLAGERAIASACDNYVILRTSWVYAGHGNNFLRTMLRLGAEQPILRVVNDQWGAPTSAEALADATRSILDRAEATPDWYSGVYHATCGGRTTWFGFAEAIFRAQAEGASGAALPKVEAISNEDYSTPARRPANSVLDNAKLRERFAIQLPDWEDALRDVMGHLVRAEPTGAARQ